MWSGSPPATGGSLLPPDLAPMLAQAADGPLDSSDYAYEVKWDGMRVLVGLDGDRLTLRTRNGIEAADRFPELAELRQAVRVTSAILDGEIVRLVDGKPNFGSLQRRIQLSNPRDVYRMAQSEPAALVLFDVLRTGHEPIMVRSWEERRCRLEEVVEPGAVIQLSPIWSDGKQLYDTVCSLGLEGVMAKRRLSRYTPGRRSPAWLKIKTCKTVEAIVGGWTEGSGYRTDSLGALLLGWFADGEFVFLGHVGTGFDQGGLDEAMRVLKPLETAECPFHPRPATNARPHWVRPEAVCEVRYADWSADGRLRFPVFERWRPDRDAADVQRSIQPYGR